jgi:hypothetical protein
VVVDYKTYKELLGDVEERPLQANFPVPSASNNATAPGEIELLERINKDILALKEQIEEEEKGLGL